MYKHIILGGRFNMFWHKKAKDKHRKNAEAKHRKEIEAQHRKKAEYQYRKEYGFQRERMNHDLQKIHIHKLFLKGL